MEGNEEEWAYNEILRSHFISKDVKQRNHSSLFETINHSTIYLLSVHLFLIYRVPINPLAFNHSLLSIYSYRVVSVVYFSGFHESIKIEEETKRKKNRSVPAPSTIIKDMDIVAESTTPTVTSNCFHHQ